MKYISRISFSLLMLASSASYSMESNLDEDNTSLLKRASADTPPFEISASGVSRFLFTDPAEYENELLKSSAVTPTIQTKVYSEEWSKTAESILEDAYRILSINPSIKADFLDHVYKTYYKPTFSRYYELYQMISGNNKNILKKIDKDLNILLDPLGHFVAVFESMFDMVKTHYRTNSNDYLIHKTRLEKEVFPTVQKTFNTFMKIYEKYSPEKIELIGPFKNKSQNFRVSSENVTKHVFYKRDINNDFLLFTLFPHTKVGENLYQSYLPYLQARDSNYIDDVIIFSLDETNTPIIDEHQGLVVSKDNAGYSLVPYRGNATSLPYTSSQALLLQNPATKEKTRAIFQIAEFLEKEELEEKEERVLNKTMELIGTTLPEELKGHTVFTQQPLPTRQVVAIEEFAKEVLGDNDCVFVPFPHTDREESEETYLFLLDLKQRLKEQEVQSADILLLDYLEKTAFPEKKLDEIIQDYEYELVDDYTKEEEEKIRLEQEARRHMVASGEVYQKRKKSKEPKKAINTSKKNKLPKKPETSPQDEVEEQINRSTVSPTEVPLETSREKAMKKLEELKRSNNNGSVKFRKFMKLVNVARQGLEQIDLAPTAELNKSSHGKIEVEGSNPQTLVRPHGKSKEKSISSRNKKKILTGLTEAFLRQLSKQDQ